METVGRNHPCPCGSGRRYKECHGAIGAAPIGSAATTAAPTSDLSWVPVAMRNALAAQKSGRCSEAAEGYRRVLAVDPSNFDAMHMLALVEYEDGRLERALALLRRAIELRPDISLARHNLRTLESMPRVEQELCRVVLPRLMPRVEPVDDIRRFVSSASRVHIVVADDMQILPHPALEHLARRFDRTRLALWTLPGTSVEIPEARVINMQTRVHPEGGIVALFGTARSPAAWLPAARPARVLLVVVREDACSLIDRIDEVSALGDSRPGLVCATRELAIRLQLPVNAVLSEPEPVAVAGT